MTFFKSFYARLSGIFLILLIIMVAVQVYITTNSWKAHYDLADQKLNKRLAKDIAAEFEPFLKDSIDYHHIHHSIHYMMVMNPKIEIYLLDNSGKILAFFAEPDKKVKVDFVNINPIRKFLVDDPQLPILGDDPRNPGVIKPFSAAHLKIGPNIDGYLYVIIGSEQFDMALSYSTEAYVAKTITNSLLITVLFTGFIGLILFAFLTRRFKKITSAVQNFERGNFTSRIDIKSTDEIGQLANTFNNMASTIEANIEELKKTDTLRRELIANVSHDLRNPLAAIRGYLETIQIKEKSLNEQERQKYISILLDTTNGLEKLVGQLFELSKLDAKQIEPAYEPFLLKEIVYDVIAKFKPRAEQAGVTLSANIPDGLPQVYADIALIERVLSNLIDNAIRYTPVNGIINISTEYEDKNIIRVRVKDTGSGIQQDELPYIFDRFYRVEKSRSEKTGGTGLGLAIAKKIIEIHKSTLSVVSELNKGSTFSFNLQAWQV